MNNRGDDFYIGYLDRVPGALHATLMTVVALVLLAFPFMALVLSRSQDDVGNGAFQWDAGSQSISGVIESRPYPMIHAGPSPAFPAGHTYLLAGEGKIGAPIAAAVMDGSTVEATGILIKRGDLDMLQVGADVGLQPATVIRPEARTLPKAVDLGRWRIRGEICDGKCYAGAMRPGAGLAHKACANLCLIGRLPPVLVTAQAVAGYTFFVLGTNDGYPLPDSILDAVAIPIEADGRIERRGDMPIFLLDHTTLRTR